MTALWDFMSEMVDFFPFTVNNTDKEYVTNIKLQVI